MGSEAGTAGAHVERDTLAHELARMVAGWGAGSVDTLLPRWEELLEAFSDDDLAAFRERFARTGADWGYNAPDPLARAISRATMSRVLQPGSGIENPEALAPARSQRAVFLGNHLSYVDVNALDFLMADAGFADVAARITTLVGPKVFTHPIRKLASLCFGTIKLPQSTSRASGEAVMSTREVAALARQTIECARERQAQGDHLLIFPEGSRSRGASLLRCLAAVARYLETDDTLVILWGHAGSERLMPIDEERVHASVVRIRFGKAFESARMIELCRGRRQLVADVTGHLIAGCVPRAYRGAYGQATDELAEAREIAQTLAG